MNNTIDDFVKTVEKKLKLDEKHHTKYKSKKPINTLEEFATSYELSKKLKEIGIPQDGAFIYRMTPKHNHISFCRKGQLDPIDTDVDSFIAAELAKWKGSKLCLDGLTTLSPETAAELAKWGGDELSLYWLYSISDEAAYELSKFNGRIDLTNKIEDKLTKYKKSD